jgi:hypothetical protein
VGKKKKKKYIKKYQEKVKKVRGWEGSLSNNKKENKRTLWMILSG